MKTLRDIENESGPVCRVWQSRPSDLKHEHTRDLITVDTPQGKIKVCSKCVQDISDIVAFQNRKFITEKESIMVSTLITVNGKKEIVKKIENGAKLYKIRKRAQANQESLFETATMN